MSEALKKKIRITNEAVTHLKHKNKPYAMIAHPDYRTSGESVFIEVPEISNKKPKEDFKFHHVTLDGIEIYIGIDVKIPEDETIEIGLDSFLGLKFLKVSGFSAVT